MIQLIVAARARRDRDEILRYLLKEAGPATAHKFAERFRDSMSRLIEMPAYGSPRFELGPTCRIAVIAPYVMLYEYDAESDHVRVLRFLHGKRGITETLLRG